MAASDEERREGQPAQAEGVGDPQVALPHQAREQVLDQLLQHPLRLRSSWLPHPQAREIRQDAVAPIEAQALRARAARARSRPARRCRSGCRGTGRRTPARVAFTVQPRWVQVRSSARKSRAFADDRHALLRQDERPLGRDVRLGHRHALARRRPRPRAGSGIATAPAPPSEGEDQRLGGRIGVIEQVLPLPQVLPDVLRRLAVHRVVAVLREEGPVDDGLLRRGSRRSAAAGRPSRARRAARRPAPAGSGAASRGTRCRSTVPRRPCAATKAFHSAASSRFSQPRLVSVANRMNCGRIGETLPRCVQAQRRRVLAS